MRVAIDTRSLRPPLAGIGHFTHRLTEAMLPLLADDETLLAFNGWSLQPLDDRFLGRVTAANSGTESSELAARRATSGGQILHHPAAELRRFAKFSVPRKRAVFAATSSVSTSFTPSTMCRRASFADRCFPSSTIFRTCAIRRCIRKIGSNGCEKQLALVADAPLVQTNSLLQQARNHCGAWLSPPIGSTSPTPRPAPNSDVPGTATKLGSLNTSLWRPATFSRSARASRGRISNRSPTRMWACRKMFGHADSARLVRTGRGGATFRCRRRRKGEGCRANPDRRLCS